MMDQSQTAVKDCIDGVPLLAASALIAIHDPLACFNRDGRFIFVNDQAAELLGKAKDELVDNLIREVFPDAGGDPYIHALLAALTEQRARCFEQYSATLDRWFESRVYPTADGLLVYALDITLRKRFEESQRDHEALLLSVGDNLPGAIYQVMASPSGERQFRYISAGIERLVGLKPADVQADAMRLYSLIVPEDIPRVLAEEERSYLAQTPFDCEFRQRTLAGEIRWMHCRSAPRRTRDGIVWDGVVLDVTDRKRAEQALERYRLLAENTRDIVLFIRTDGRIVDANTAALQAYGYSHEELMARSIAELRDPSTLHLLADQMRQADERGVTFETMHRRKDGTLFPVEVSSRGTEAHGERVLLSIVRDITSRRRAAKSLEFLAEASKVLASSLDYETTLSTVARLSVPELADWCAIDVVDPDGSIRRVTVAHVEEAKIALAHEAHRLAQADARTDHVRRIVESGQSELCPELTDEMLQAGIADPRLLEVLRQLGLKSYIGVPLKVRDRTLGALTFVAAESGRRFDAADLALAEDLAYRAAMAIENSRLYAEVSEASRRKDDFLATLAHELRNPLAPIRNASELFRMCGQLAPELEQARDIVDRQVEQLTRLVDDLLDVSRFTRGKIELRRERVNLASLINRAVEVSRPLVEASLHQLVIEHSSEPLWLDADPMRMTQIVANLLNNSAKYTESKGRISVATSRQGDDAVIVVCDNGIGIPSEMLSRIFEPFMQADVSVERRQGGLGIGLSLVQKLVELHGGSIEAESPGHGQGSTFTVRLPLATGDEPNANRPSSRADAPGRSARGPHKKGGKRRVLVADDNRDAADTLAMLFRKLGHDVRTVYDGPQALEVASDYHPHLLVLDIGMPAMSGYEVARRLRTQPGFGESLLVAITGWGQEEDRRRTREAGFDYHLVKPVEIKTLEDLLSRLATNRT
jgi:PAS domain S-box-containing protein